MLAHHDIPAALLVTASLVLFCGREAVTQPIGDGGPSAQKVLLKNQAKLPDSLRRIKKPNPVWIVPLGSLSQTRERPLFSSSRRPPMPPVVPDPLPSLVTAPKPTPAAPDRVGLLLMGTVLGHLNIAILRQENTEISLRLHAGQNYEGWILQRIDRREVTFEKGKDTAVLTISNPVPEQLLRMARASERPNAITQFAMPTPEPGAGGRCVRGLTAQMLPYESAVCAVGRGRAFFHPTSN